MTKYQVVSHGYRIACMLVLAMAACLSSSVWANAEPPGPVYWLYDGTPRTRFEHGQFYASITFDAVVQQLPRWHSTFSFISIASASLTGPQPFSPEPTGVQPGGEIGFVFRDGTLPAWMGTRVRIGLYGSYFRGVSNQEKNFLQIPDYSQFFTQSGFNGQPLLKGPIVAGTYSEALRVERETFQVGLKLESDIALRPNLSLTPAVAVFGGRAYDSYAMRGGLVTITNRYVPFSTSEKLRTRE
ncbi:MAG: hypothetical protein KIT16_17455, partial [Rhodospirillaceae bacterium]|nr:hypothetical protein [Rhodospirillaceae bacterium]